MKETPPFRLARSSSKADDFDGRTEGRLEPPKLSFRAQGRRVLLAELDPQMHCSIIGTCLGTSDLRKLVPKFTGIDREHASDLEIHQAAVDLAIRGGPASKALHKTLDERYAGAIRRFSAACAPQAVLALWEESCKNGDIASAYWALMTHPQSTIEVREAAFGTVHMLSHLVGASSRADIRRLIELEKKNAALSDKVERQQSRLQEMSAQRDASLRLGSEQAQNAPRMPGHNLESEVQRLRMKLDDSERRMALYASRCDAAERRAILQSKCVSALQRSLDESHALVKVMQAECLAIERAMTMESSRSGEGDQRSEYSWLSGKRVLYVGGRPRTNTALKAIVVSMGGEFVLHDGGVEDRKGLLATTLPGADLVVFPVDCIDHASMNTVKRVCDRYKVPYYPLRTASVASFVELVARLARDR